MHVRAARRPLPDSIAIYFHALNPAHHHAFRHAIASIRDRGYEITGSTQRLLEGRGRTAWISFDDNFRSWFESLDLLESLDARATFFLNTEPLRDKADDETIRRYYERIDDRTFPTPLSSDEIREMSRAGHVIAAHTHVHHNLASVPVQRVVDDMRLNIEMIESITGTAVQDFAIPFGMRRFYDTALEAPIMALGISTISYAIPAMQHARPDPPYLHRSQWHLDRSVEENWQDIEVDGRAFERATGRSAVG
jgi:peptidoglycan/xylan/chitin deacetylase (PgdA/CDA1 family)